MSPLSSLSGPYATPPACLLCIWWLLLCLLPQLLNSLPGPACQWLHGLPTSPPTHSGLSLEANLCCYHLLGSPKAISINKTWNPDLAHNVPVVGWTPICFPHDLGSGVSRYRLESLPWSFLCSRTYHGIKDLNLRAKIIKLLEENIAENLHDIEFGSDSMYMISKAHAIKDKIEKLNFI